jgi:UDP-N-acetylmuramoyl-tripeptide--D-alanyl-D-alanine ligase
VSLLLPCVNFPFITLGISDGYSRNATFHSKSSIGFTLKLTIQDLVSIGSIQEIGVRELGLSRMIRDVSTDSRTIKRDDLFVALMGEHFDGHRYLSEVAKEGAIAAVVSEEWYAKHKAQVHPLPLLVVTNTLDAFGELAKIYRNKFNIPVLVIAGSNGKTTTKELIAHVLSGSFDVLKTEANFNNQIGVPHTLFQLRDGHEAAVLEIGTNHPGEIAWLCEVAQPTHGLITNIGREHLEFFKDVKGVAQEEKAVFDYLLHHDGFAFINMDDPYLKPTLEKFGDRAMTYGTSQDQDSPFVQAQKVGYAKDGRAEIQVVCEGKPFHIRTHLFADYAPNTIAATIAVGLHFHMRRVEIKPRIEFFHPHSDRLEMIHLDGITVLNDVYNANPDSMESALRTLKEFPIEGRRFAVLGDMLELGSTSGREHRALGRTVAEFKFHHVYFTGKDAKQAYNAAVEASNNPNNNSYFAEKEKLAAVLRDMLHPGDALLIKGSRGMKMEELIDLLQKG